MPATGTQSRSRKPGTEPREKRASRKRRARTTEAVTVDDLQRFADDFRKFVVSLIDQAVSRVQELLAQQRKAPTEQDEYEAMMEVKTAPLELTPAQAEAFDKLTSRRSKPVAKPLPLD